MKRRKDGPIYIAFYFLKTLYFSEAVILIWNFKFEFYFLVNSVHEIYRERRIFYFLQSANKCQKETEKQNQEQKTISSPQNRWKGESIQIDRAEQISWIKLWTSIIIWYIIYITFIWYQFIYRKVLGFKMHWTRRFSMRQIGAFWTLRSNRIRLRHRRMSCQKVERPFFYHK